MSQTIRVKRSVTSGVVPSGLLAGELALNIADMILYAGTGEGSNISFPSGGGAITQQVIASTSGAITVDWSTSRFWKQNEPTGTITYTFTAPPGPCHLQLLIDSDGTSTAQTISWPTSPIPVIWLGTTWTAVANKKAIINFWYDGSNYYAMGSNQI